MPLDKGAVHVGRAPDNDLVLSDATISWHHAVIWRMGETVFIRDRGSTNGTFLNGWPVRLPLAIEPGDEIRLGTSTTLALRGLPASERPQGPLYLLEDLESGVRTPVVGGAPQPDELTVAEDGSVLLNAPSGSKALEVNETFLLGDRKFRLVRGDTLPVETVGQGEESYPFRLTVTLEGTTGPEALIEHRVEERSHRITAENRVVLLYVLARRLISDRTRHRSHMDAGWCSDEEVAVGIWGREGAGMDVNTLHVLLHRLRKDIETAGFDPSFIEKRRKALRLRLLDVAVR